METQVRIRLETRLLPALVALLLLLQMAVPYRGWWVLLVGLGGLWLLTYLWTRILIAGLHLERRAQTGLLQVGSRVEEHFTLRNDSPLPALWVEVTAHSTMPGDYGGLVTTLGGRRSLRWQSRAICIRRGLFTLGPTTLRTGDPFGLYTATVHYPATASLTVLPPLVHLPSIHIAPGGPLQTGEERTAAAAARFTVSAAGVREYQPGDSLRWIHWRTTARHDALFVRLFDGTPPTTSWWLLLDLEGRVQVGRGLDATDEHAVILAASLADQGLRAGRAVGLAAHGRETLWMPPREGDTQRWEILRALAQAERGDRPLDDLIARMQGAIARQASLVILTPSLERSWIESLVLLIEGGALPSVLLLDPVSYGGSGDLAAAQALLAELGVPCTVMTHAMLDQRGLYAAAARGRRLPQARPARPLPSPLDPVWRVLT